MYFEGDQAGDLGTKPLALENFDIFPKLLNLRSIVMKINAFKT